MLVGNDVRDATLNWSANELLLISFRADRGVEFKRLNDVQKGCKEACCCRGITQNNEKRAGKCAVKCKMEMSGVYHVVCTHVLFVVVLF